MKEKMNKKKVMAIHYTEVEKVDRVPTGKRRERQMSSAEAQKPMRTAKHPLNPARVPGDRWSGGLGATELAIRKNAVFWSLGIASKSARLAHGARLAHLADFDGVPSDQSSPSGPQSGPDIRSEL
ncbi:hypothetical protein CC1G_15620 [Coprinopsis cinerea okayama7|uniref:Uncharacterized protein n=1 Tax=Coprinopsis cinerea (strain Okayama-7 / 130 / ATCC MYA-4618 / FGSC 9003) TaxID=240176 RepID=D6RNF0_COPC7|nr:hypothetical protein CC1G_15620 [Coprinopsis cinerea okayama7\|eukprot:XP_002911078.1 hypothetical protein CC1G_15620 [Coprinopsis cinerea okayama7\